jgi:signal transduction histidine kinase
MSHELRTPLNAIGGYAELLELGIHGPVTTEQREALARIQRSQQHLLGLINDVLNFVKLEAGHARYWLEDVPLRSALEIVEDFVGPQLRAKGIRYELELRAADEDAGPLVVRADPEKLRQILLNLLSNAVKFTDVGGVIRVSCHGDAGAVRVEVTDTGIGIPADRIENVFEPFVQIGRQLNHPSEGVGLGLAISRDLARGMGGDLTASSGVGRGSTFTLTLPPASPAA